MPGPQLDFVHRFVPAQPGGPRFTLLLLHGTGGNESDLLGLGAELAPGAALLSPRGKVLENGMPRFFRRFAEGVFDVEDVKLRAGELADFVDAAAAHYAFDGNRVVAVGYSNGANVAAAMLLLRPQTLAAAVLFRPMLPVMPADPPDLRGRRVLISAGDADPVAPRTETDALIVMLAASGTAIEVNRVNAGHGLTPGEIAHAREWLRQAAA